MRQLVPRIIKTKVYCGFVKYDVMQSGTCLWRNSLPPSTGKKTRLHGVSSEGLISNEVTTVETSIALQNPAALEFVTFSVSLVATCSECFRRNFVLGVHTQGIGPVSL